MDGLGRITKQARTTLLSTEIFLQRLESSCAAKGPEMNVIAMNLFALAVYLSLRSRGAHDEKVQGEMTMDTIVPNVDGRLKAFLPAGPGFLLSVFFFFSATPPF